MDKDRTYFFPNLTVSHYASLAALIIILASFFGAPGALAQAGPSPPGAVSSGDANAGVPSAGAFQAQYLVAAAYPMGNGFTNLVQQQAEQNTIAVAQNVEQQLWPDFGAYNDTYDGLSSFGAADPLGDLVFFLARPIPQVLTDLLFNLIHNPALDSLVWLVGLIYIVLVMPVFRRWRPWVAKTLWSRPISVNLFFCLPGLEVVLIVALLHFASMPAQIEQTRLFDAIQGSYRHTSVFEREATATSNVLTQHALLTLGCVRNRYVYEALEEQITSDGPWDFGFVVGLKQWLIRRVKWVETSGWCRICTVIACCYLGFIGGRILRRQSLFR
jgi:hypothetical protein